MHRKIEREMVLAISELRSWASGNTAVTVTPFGSGHRIDVTLHGNLIAMISTYADTIKVSLAGWNTRTTRSRLNALLGCFVGLGSHVSGPLKADTALLNANGEEIEFSAARGVFVEIPMGGEFNRRNRVIGRAVDEVQRARLDVAVEDKQREIKAGTAQYNGGSTWEV